MPLQTPSQTAVLASTIISLACGTNYIYSAWSPQFAQRLTLSATQANLIGTLGNLGMYASGIPCGMLVDARGPRVGVMLGALLFLGGYAPLAVAFRQAGDAGAGAGGGQEGDFWGSGWGVLWLCVFSFLTGAGSCAAFTAAIKLAALAYPGRSGSATAFPLAAFGLSAAFFAAVAAAVLSPGDTYGVLVLLAVGTVLLPVGCLPFVGVKGLSRDADRERGGRRRRRRRKSLADVGQDADADADANTPSGSGRASRASSTPPPPPYLPAHDDDEDADEDVDAPFLPSDTDDEATPADLARSKSSEQLRRAAPPSDSDTIDIRGMALTRLPRFWLVFALLCLLSGTGLMTINNIGNVVLALWRSSRATSSSSSSPPKVIAAGSAEEEASVHATQSLHVTLLSLSSFTGRLLSGIGSDFLVINLRTSRFWCLVASSLLFCVAQYAASAVTTLPSLWLVSVATGLGYGVLFGVYPVIVKENFGVKGLSQNWGTMTLAPVLSGNLFNFAFGLVLDANSGVGDAGERVCLQGRECYRMAFWVTLFAAALGVGLSGFAVWVERRERRARDRGMGRGRGRLGRVHDA
jgi:MFS family permease